MAFVDKKCHDYHFKQLKGLLSFDIGPKVMAVFDFGIKPKPKNWFRSQTSESNNSTYQKFTTTTYEKT